MRIREITESLGTTSGAVATVSTPLGGTISRSGGGGDMFFFGKPVKSSDPFPNTPAEYKKKSKKK